MTALRHRSGQRFGGRKRDENGKPAKVSGLPEFDRLARATHLRSTMGTFANNSSKPKRSLLASSDRAVMRRVAGLAARKAKPTVLLVDDDCAVRNGISRVLATEALEVITAQGVKDALDHIYRAVPDLVVTDLCMSPLTGWDLIEFLGPRYPDLPIFVITAQRLPFASAVEGYSAAFFQKPLDFDALLGAIRQRLGLPLTGNEDRPFSA